MRTILAMARNAEPQPFSWSAAELTVLIGTVRAPAQVPAAASELAYGWKRGGAASVEMALLWAAMLAFILAVPQVALVLYAGQLALTAADLRSTQPTQQHQQGGGPVAAGVEVGQERRDVVRLQRLGQPTWLADQPPAGTVPAESAAPPSPRPPGVAAATGPGRRTDR